MTALVTVDNCFVIYGTAMHGYVIRDGEKLQYQVSGILSCKYGVFWLGSRHYICPGRRWLRRRQLTDQRHQRRRQLLHSILPQTEPICYNEAEWAACTGSVSRAPIMDQPTSRNCNWKGDDSRCEKAFVRRACCDITPELQLAF